MGKSAAGRMINQDISFSLGVASLSPEELALFCLLIPHFDSHGKMVANPNAIKGIVCPLIEWLTVEKIKECLVEISAKTSVKWWMDKKGLSYLHSLNWNEHQDLRADRLGVDKLPDYPGGEFHKYGSPEGELQEYSRSTPGVLPLEVKVEGEDKGGIQPSSDALRLSGLLADLIANNNSNNRTIQPGQRQENVERWAVDIDRMLRLDDRDLQKVEDVVRWAQDNDFWRTNILSGAKLRKQFDQLSLQMQNTCKKSAGVPHVVRRVY